MKRVRLLLKAYVLVLLLVLVMVVTGCAGQKNEPPKENKTPQQTETTEKKSDLELTVLMDEWDASDHSKVIATPAGRDNCVLCHSGYAFAKDIKEVAKLPEGRKVPLGGEGETGAKPEPAGGAAPKAGEATPTASAVTPTDCYTCHAGRAIGLMEKGETSIPTKQNVKAGKSALCIACHNPRKVPDIKDPNRTAPHYSAQSDVFYGSGGIRKDGFKLNNSAHTNIENPCIYCHMPESDKGQTSHTFKMNTKYINKTCGKCHQNISNFNRQAGDDYDGDGKKEGAQDEVTGLLDLLKGEIGKKLNGGTFKPGGGKVTFLDAAGKEITASDEIYLATYNYYLVSNDGSRGIHNPTFAVQLLQQSYKTLTGKDVPNAKIK